MEECAGEVARGDVSAKVSAVGTPGAAQPTDVKPLVGGTIAALPVKEGDYVNAGDVLATLDEKSSRPRRRRPRPIISPTPP